MIFVSSTTVLVFFAAGVQCSHYASTSYCRRYCVVATGIVVGTVCAGTVLLL